MLIYEYKLDGTQAQYRAIDEAIRVTQFIRNKCLRLWMDTRGINRNDLQCFCSELAKAYDFAILLNSQARQAAADRAWVAISRFYDNCRNQKPGKKGYPQFQHDCRSVEYKQTGWRLEPDGRHLTFTDGCGIGRLRLIGSRDLATRPLPAINRVRLIRRADGYYAQFAIQAERHIEHVPTGTHTGIDLGLKAFLTDAEGNTVANPRHLRKAERKLKRLHRRLSRTQKKSQQRKKARKKLAKGYLKVQRQREDFARKTANALITSHDLIAYEHLRIANLVKNRKLAKSISDAAWGRFIGWLNYYAALHHIPVIAVEPAFTSQDCSACGARVKKSLSVRTHICPSCGVVLDRDHNGARNILAKAYRTVGQTGTGEAQATPNASGQNASTRSGRKARTGKRAG
ncbi:RNA-guided endonuclease InsQ/TnpB family protein [Ktedonobacter racemifer]|uniref:Transposase, IS605 OrfB family n=1 Tax=Ktedonobacter racemifer DSM 44963 TaxID=485913 RepID=D6U5M1_KTERA|nr:RNA-guided endonuclease TnpB family protein [Ktedonobacter racemifer]EFH80282.1 transposase, IS605 OrfB family [Ktedonobacter racemifer DSM 44963]